MSHVIDLPIIELDMTKKDGKYRIDYPAFSGEDNVYNVRFKLLQGDALYDWSDGKTVSFVYSPERTKIGYPSPA
jgi:hypothetical protein